MPTPKEWQENLTRLQELSGTIRPTNEQIEAVMEGILGAGEENPDAPQEELPPKTAAQIRETLRNPDNASMVVVASNLNALLRLSDLGTNDNDEMRVTILAVYLKQFIKELMNVYDKAIEEESKNAE